MLLKMSGPGSVRFTVGLNNLKSLFQPKLLYDFVILPQVFILEHFPDFSSLSTVQIIVSSPIFGICDRDFFASCIMDVSCALRFFYCVRKVFQYIFLEK